MKDAILLQLTGLTLYRELHDVTTAPPGSLPADAQVAVDGAVDTARVQSKREDLCGV